jgi:predicted TIM-barrel fold metal-dependent hydrolase
VNRRIDTHVHVYDYGTLECRRSPYTSPVVAPDGSAPVEWLLADMEHMDVARAVIVQHSAFGDDNSYLAACIGRFPQALRAIGLLDPFDLAIDSSMARWLHAGLAGFRFHLFYPAMEHWLDSEQARLAFASAAELGAILQFHLVPENAGPLASLLRRHRDVRVVIDHLGKPDVLEPAPYPSFGPVLRLADFENCYMKIGDYEKASKEPYPWRDTWPFVELLRRHFGAERMMWGTGFPGAHRKVPLAQSVRYVAADLPFTDLERDQILWATPAQLFSFDRVARPIHRPRKGTPS